MRQTTEDYLKTILVLRKTKGIVRSVDIANKLGVTRPTVCMFIKRLVDEGYIFTNDEHEISLTENGEKIASVILERNLTFQQVLESLGVDKKTAQEDACKMEHAVSDKSFEALKKAINDSVNK